MKTKPQFRGRHLESDVSLQYADITDENGHDAGTLSAIAETYQDGWDIHWTGNIEVLFKASNSEEFDVIEVVQDHIKPSQEANEIKAKAAIKRCMSDAKELEMASRGGE